MAKNLGIKYGPQDLTIEQLNMFTLIKEILDELEDKNGGRHKT